MIDPNVFDQQQHSDKVESTFVSSSKLQVYPESVQFHGIEANIPYLMAVTIQNVSNSETLRFRIIPPKSSFFSIVAPLSSPTQLLAPGLTSRFDVQFEYHEDEDDNCLCEFHDMVEILSDQYNAVNGTKKERPPSRLQIPLHGYPPKSRIEFNGFVDLGPVVLKNRKAAFVTFQQAGHSSGGFQIELDPDLPITITPSKAVLFPRQSKTDRISSNADYLKVHTDRNSSIQDGDHEVNVKIEFEGMELGIFRSIATVKLDNQPDRVLDINATVIEHNLQLISTNGTGHVSAVPFGTLYLGQERTIEAILVNNGPHQASFQNSVTFIDDPSNSESNSDNLMNQECDDEQKKGLTISPMEGIIKPYSQAVIKMIYKPLKQKRVNKSNNSDPLNTMEKTLLNAALTIESSEINQKIVVDVSGQVIIPNIELSRKVFDFGGCGSNERVDLIFDIKNAGIMSLTYAINKIAHFSCKPNKGRLQSMQSQSIILSFTPNQLGKFANTLHLVVGNNLKIIPIKVKGVANYVGKKAAPVGGTTKVPEDFEPKYNFVNPEDVSVKKTDKFTRIPPWSKGISKLTDLENIEFRRHLTYSVKELKDRSIHSNRYNNFLKESFARREEKTQEQQFIPNKTNESLNPFNHVNIGLEPQSGVEGEFPSLPECNEPLWLKSNRNMLGNGLLNRKGSGHDENKIIRKKFKSLPVTQAEVKDCAMLLNSDDLKKIIAGPKTLNFSKVCVQSVSKKSFSVTNEYTRNILVSLSITNDMEELQQSSPLSQVIPPGGTAGFDITFFSRVEQAFHKNVNYVINGHHVFKMSILAEVVPISLNLSEEILEFSFPETSLDFTLVKSIFLTNPGNADAVFQWEVCDNPLLLGSKLDGPNNTEKLVPSSIDGSSYSIEPIKGNIAPGGNLEIVVRFTPQLNKSNESYFRVCVNGGKGKLLHCFSEFQEPTCAIKERKIDFGVIPAGIEKQKRVCLTNSGNLASVFEVEPIKSSVIDCFRVSPMTGIIESNETVELMISLQADSELQLEGVYLQIKIRGAKSLRVPILGQLIIPHVEISSPSKFDFGGITIGVSSIITGTIINRGIVPATLFLNLSPYGEEFDVSIPPSVSAENEDVHAVFALIGDRETPECDHTDGYATKKWRLYIDPEKRLQFNLKFSPAAIKSHSFLIPISIAGLPKVALDHYVYAEGLKPRMLLSSSIIDFKDRVVSRESNENIRMVPYTMELKLTNDDISTVTWDISTKRLKENVLLRKVFHLAPERGELAAGDTCSVRINFLPIDAKDYDIVLPVVLDNDFDRVYVHLTIKGTGIYPHLSFSSSQVVLPIVPLGIRSRTKFEIFSVGYDNLELSYRLPVDTSKVPISLSFPNGKNIGMANPKVPVEIEFHSKKPLSFTAKIEFYDVDGNQFNVPVIGTTDNCLLTTISFLDMHRNEYSLFNRRAKPIIPISLLDNQSIKVLKKKIDLFNEAESNKSDKNVNIPHSKVKLVSVSPVAVEKEFHFEPTGSLVHSDESYQNSVDCSEQSVSLFIKWLNANILRNPIFRIPEDFISGNGSHIFEIMEVICAKPVPGRISTSRFPNLSKKEQLGLLMNQYTELLRFLKTYGALLHDIRPEHFLSDADFVRYREKIEIERSSKAKLNGIPPEKRQAFENEIRQYSLRTWISVVSQIIKIFVLFRVNLKNHAELPGVLEQSTNPEKNAALRNAKSSKSTRSKALGSKKNSELFEKPSKEYNSNIYSLPEIILLDWLSFHFKRAALATQPRDIIDFENDLKDGCVICYLLISHIPTLALEKGILSEFHRNPTTAHQEQQNAEMIRKALIELGIDYGIPADILLKLNAQHMMLFILHLYQTIPQFIPKATIEFSGMLGQTLVKYIELKNPSKKSIKYQVILEGSIEFQVMANSLELEPEACESFLVQCKPRFTRTVEARLTFRTVKERHEESGNIQDHSNYGMAATMVFVLKSKVNSRQPVRIINVESTTYEAKNTDIIVENQFSSVGVYSLSILHENSHISQSPVDSFEGNFLSTIQPAFYCKSEAVTIQEKSNATVTIQFLPLRPGNYRCQLLLLDENVGEFMYEIYGKAGLPAVLERIKFSSEMKPQISRELTIPYRNLLLIRALNIYVERLNGPSKTKARDSVKKLEENLNTIFKVELHSPFWSSTCSDINITSSADYGSNSTGKKIQNDRALLHTPRGMRYTNLKHEPSVKALNKVANNGNRLPILFQPKGAGLYICRAVFRSGNDIRVFEIEANVTSVGIKTSLEFNTPARQAIVQEIPFVNNTDSQWNLKASITSEMDADGKKANLSFFGPSTLAVGSKQSSIYMLNFKPQWICEEHALLVLTNTATEEKFEYELIGIGEEPLAEDHISIICKAREKIQHIFSLQKVLIGIKSMIKKESYDKSQKILKYLVESDLPHVSGASEVDVDLTHENINCDYILNFNPLIGGTYFGSVTFTNKLTKEYIWYTVEAQVASPDPESTLDIKSVVRGAVAVQVSLINPLDEPVQFDIELKGSGLSGEPSLKLDPHQTAMYELIFSPLLPGTQTGAIVFANDQIGEFWYRLNLSAESSPPVQLSDMNCAVGSTSSQPIALSNPIGEELNLSFKITNKRNYSIRDAHVILHPYETTTVILDYTPSSLTEVEETEIIFQNQRLGDWVYCCRGSGKPPSLMKTTFVSCSVGQVGTALIPYRNPFPDPLSITVLLAEVPPVNGSKDNSGGSFKLLLKKEKFLLGGFSNVQVPVSFSPSHVAEMNALLTIQGHGDLKWSFPIRGVAEAPCSCETITLSCRARETCEKTLVLDLAGIGNLETEEQFTHELDIHSDHKNLVEKSLIVTPISTTISTSQEVKNLQYHVKFIPLRAFTTKLSLIVNKKSGGRWRYEIQVVASDPVVDDTITIQSTLHQTSTISFKLTNQFREYATFHAEFSSNSSPAFTVFPTTGELEPYGSAGTQLMVSFTPTAYGKTAFGKLIILTDEMQWMYDVRGTHPDYKAPQVEAKVKNVLEPSIASLLGQKKKNKRIHEER